MTDKITEVGHRCKKSTVINPRDNFSGVARQGAARSVDAADGSGRSAAGGSGAGSAVVESAAGGSAAGESGAGSAAVSAAGESGAGSTAGGSSAGAAVADAGADPGAVNVAAGATGSVPPVPYFEEVDLDIEEQSEPKKQQAPVAAENLSISLSLQALKQLPQVVQAEIPL
ncbi:unnamed protein product [Arctogadus glacialis]